MAQDTYFSNAATATATTITSAPASLHSLECSNPNATDVFVQLFNLPARIVTLGTTTPKMSLLVPGGAGASNRGATDKMFDPPIYFDEAMSFAVTTTPAGSTAPTTNSTLNVGYA